jgi:hypothetical protein
LITKRPRKPHAPKNKRKRKNPTAKISPDQVLNTPAMQDFIGNMLLGIAMERLGIRGRDVLAVAAGILAPSAVYAPATQSEKPLGPETPAQVEQPEESTTDEATSTKQACSTDSPFNIDEVLPGWEKGNK